MTRVLRRGALSEMFLLLCQKRKTNKEINIIRHNGRNDIIHTYIIYQIYVSTWPVCVHAHIIGRVFILGRRTRGVFEIRVCADKQQQNIIIYYYIIIIYVCRIYEKPNSCERCPLYDHQRVGSQVGYIYIYISGYCMIYSMTL